MTQQSHEAAGHDGRAVQTDLTRLLKRYETALNTSDLEAVMQAFAADAVFMAPNRAAVVGASGIRAAYLHLFEQLSFETSIQVEEVRPIADGWAFARTRSAGVVTLKPGGERVEDANHELFILQRTEDAAWRIARYCFATTLPLRR